MALTSDTGLLKDRRFTIHWQNKEALAEKYPLLLPTDKIFEIDQRVVTCAGGAAATDLALEIIARDFDRELAARIAEHCLQAGNRTGEDRQRAPLNIILGTRNKVLIAAVNQMLNNIEDPVELKEIAQDCGVSKRQIERLFRRYVGMSPGNYYKFIRLEHARRLISQTDLSISEIAFASGYNSIGAFLKGFRSKYGRTANSVRCPNLELQMISERKILNTEETSK